MLSLQAILLSVCGRIYGELKYLDRRFGFYRKRFSSLRQILRKSLSRQLTVTLTLKLCDTRYEPLP